MLIFSTAVNKHGTKITYTSQLKIQLICSLLLMILILLPTLVITFHMSDSKTLMNSSTQSVECLVAFK